MSYTYYLSDLKYINEIINTCQDVSLSCINKNEKVLKIFIT